MANPHSASNVIHKSHLWFKKNEYCKQKFWHEYLGMGSFITLLQIAFSTTEFHLITRKDVTGDDSYQFCTPVNVKNRFSTIGHRKSFWTLFKCSILWFKQLKFDTSVLVEFIFCEIIWPSIHDLLWLITRCLVINDW